MEYVLPDKKLLEKRSDEIKGIKEYYNLSKLVYHKDFRDKLVFPIGISEENEKYYIDFNLKSGMLVSGETGSGKSIFLNSVIISLLLKNTPDDLQFIFIDPRDVEFKAYEGIPHLYGSVYSDKDESFKVLKQVMKIMEERQKLFIKNKVTDIESYNENNENKLPQILLVIDEILDILDAEMVKKFVDKILIEGYKYGIHLILATSSYFKTYFEQETTDMFNYILTFDLASKEQANFIRIKYSDLLSLHGDALVRKQSNILDIQTPYVSDKDIEEITNFWSNQKNTNN